MGVTVPHAGTVTSAPAVQIPAALLPATAASAAVRRRSAPRPWRPWRRPAGLDGDIPPAGTSARRRPRGALRAAGAVRSPGRVGGRARQRRLDRILGRRHLRADRVPQPAPRLRRVLRQVRRRRRPGAPPRRTGDHPQRARHPPGAGGRCQRRRLRAHPQRDLDRRHGWTLRRPEGEALVVVDATPAPVGCRGPRPRSTSTTSPPQKCFGSDGGLWLACCSPAALERIERIATSGRWVPASLDLRIALENSRADQTYNTPARRRSSCSPTSCVGCSGTAASAGASSAPGDRLSCLYGWAEARAWAQPFVAGLAERSTVVGTIDLTVVDATRAAVRGQRASSTRDSYRKPAEASSASACSPRSSPRSRGADPLHRPRGRAAGVNDELIWHDRPEPGLHRPVHRRVHRLVRLAGGVTVAIRHLGGDDGRLLAAIDPDGLLRLHGQPAHGDPRRRRPAGGGVPRNEVRAGAP